MARTFAPEPVACRLGQQGLHRLGITPTPVSAKLPDILGHVDERQARYARYRAAR